jgi:hypothetical protein
MLDRASPLTLDYFEALLGGSHSTSFGCNSMRAVASSSRMTSTEASRQLRTSSVNSTFGIVAGHNKIDQQQPQRFPRKASRSPNDERQNGKSRNWVCPI